MPYHRSFGAVPFSRSTAHAPRIVRPAQVAPIRATASAGQYAPRTTFAPVAQRSTDVMAPRPPQVAAVSHSAASAYALPASSATVRHSEYVGNYRPLRALPTVPSEAFFQPPRSAVTAVSLPFRPVPSRQSAVTAIDLPFQPPASSSGRRRRR